MSQCGVYCLGIALVVLFLINIQAATCNSCCNGKTPSCNPTQCSPNSLPNAEVQKNIQILTQIRKLLTQLSPVVSNQLTPTLSVPCQPLPLPKPQQVQQCNIEAPSIFPGATSATAQPSALIQRILQILSEPTPGLGQCVQAQANQVPQCCQSRLSVNLPQVKSNSIVQVTPVSSSCACARLTSPPENQNSIITVTKQQASIPCSCGCNKQPVVNNEVTNLTAAPIVVIPQLPAEESGSPQVSSFGPSATSTAVLALPPVYLQPVDAPVVHLPEPVLPPPRVISNKCSCTKVVVKPQLYQRIVHEKKNLRFLKKTARLVTDQVSYCAKPKC